ncbi:MAG: hypothetical protein HYZ53_10850 [Planctomycetes bacterium]|nr:hypothetical protein [Planctomycetota bacterium]
MTRWKVVRLVVVLGLGLAAGGCEWDRFTAWQVASLIRSRTAAFERETDVEVARERGSAMLFGIDLLIRSAPTNAEFLTAGARLNTMYAFALVEEEHAARACAYYAKARGYGLRALARRPGFAAAAETGGPALDAALSRFRRGELEPLFWTAYATGLRVNLRRDDPRGLAALPAATQMMTRVAALDANFYHAAPRIFLGVVHGMRSATLGGELPASRREFEDAIRRTRGRYLLARVLFARHYAVQAQDRALFLRELERVRDASDALDPSQGLANAVAKRRAERLLARVDDLFLPGEGGGSESK